MNIEELFLSIMVHDLKNKKDPKKYGEFIEMVIDILPLKTRRSLRCCSKFFQETIAPEYGGCFFFDLSRFNPIEYCYDNRRFQITEPFSGDIFIYDRATKTNYSLAQSYEFDGMERTVDIQIIGKAKNSCLVIKTLIIDEGQVFKEVFSIIPKRNFSSMTIYFVESYDVPSNNKGNNKRLFNYNTGR